MDWEYTLSECAGCSNKFSIEAMSQVLRRMREYKYHSGKSKTDPEGKNKTIPTEILTRSPKCFFAVFEHFFRRFFDRFRQQVDWSFTQAAIISHPRLAATFVFFLWDQAGPGG